MIAKLATRFLDRFCPLYVLGISGRHACLMRKHRDGSATMIECREIKHGEIIPVPARTVVIYEQP